MRVGKNGVPMAFGVAAAWLTILCVFVPTARAQTLEPITVALLVGNRTYQGKQNLPDLQYTDEDVLRMTKALLPFVDPENIKVLLSPSPEVAAALEELGMEPFWYPDRFHLYQAVDWLESRTRALRKEYGDTVQIRAILYFTAHGDVQGIHLARGVLPGRVLMGLVDSLSADSVLLVADACFSFLWMQLKGESGEVFPDDEVFAALRGIERVGTVSAQSATREEHDVVKGGLLTHVFVSGVLGAADLNQNGRVDYEELEAYLDYYARENPALKRVRVQAPKPVRGRVQPVLDPTGSRVQGIVFPPAVADGDTCYWVEDHSGRLVAELCKPAGAWRRLILLPGRYHVIAFDPTTRRSGVEGDIQVVKHHFIPIKETEFVNHWAWMDGSKGATGEQATPGARALTGEEANYLEMSPILPRAVSWKNLPGRVRHSVRLGESTGLVYLSDHGERDDTTGGGNASIQHNARVDSLTQERPFTSLSITADVRARLEARGYLTIGGTVDAGISFGNLVGCAEGVSVYRVRYLARFGWEWPRGPWSRRLVVTAGGFSAAQFRRDPSDCHPELSAYQLPFGATAGLEASIDRELGGSTRVEVGIRPEVAAEPHDADSSPVALFAGFSTFAGVRW